MQDHAGLVRDNPNLIAYEFLRDEIKREDLLTHQRLSASLAFQGILMAAMALVLSNGWLTSVAAKDAPAGLTERVINIIKYRTARTVRDDYWAFVMDRLKTLPDAETPIPSHSENGKRVRLRLRARLALAMKS